jgi:hypothetical protein
VPLEGLDQIKNPMTSVSPVFQIHLLYLSYKLFLLSILVEEPLDIVEKDKIGETENFMIQIIVLWAMALCILVNPF